MKTAYILVLLGAAILSIASADGVAEEQNKDRTGSPDGSNTCTACHTGGGFNPQLSILIENEQGEVVDSYIPGETYRLKYSISSIPFPSVYGFQSTVIFNNLSDAGEFSNPGFGVQIEEVSNMTIPSRHIVEHSSPGFIGNFQVDWTSPLNGEDVTIYASAVTANGNDEPEGDKATNTSVTIAAADPDGIEEAILSNFRLMTFEDSWMIKHPLGIIADEILVIDINGKGYTLYGDPTRIDRTDIDSGLFFIIVKLSNHIKTFKVLNI